MSTEKHKKQLSRVKRFIVRAKKRGYKFSEDLITSLPELSTQKLKSLTPKKLYEQATSTKYGIELTGTRTRELERSLSAKRGAETRKRFFEQENRQEQYSEEPTSFEDTVLRNLEAEIDDVLAGTRKQWRKGARELKQILETEISKFGRARVAQALERDASKSLSAARGVIYESSDTKRDDAVTRLLMIIEGSIPTIEDLKPFDTMG